jgi:hypothetical protein
MYAAAHAWKLRSRNVPASVAAVRENPKRFFLSPNLEPAAIAAT